MRYSQLFEIDPELGRMLGRAARGVKDAGFQSTGVVSDVQGRVEKGIDNLEKEIAKNPNQTFAATFKNFLEKEKEAVKVTDKIGMDYDNGRLIRSGKPNSSYIRGVLAKFYKQLNQYIEKTQKQASKDYFGKQNPGKGFRPQI